MNNETKTRMSWGEFCDWMEEKEKEFHRDNNCKYGQSTGYNDFITQCDCEGYYEDKL